MSKKFRTTGPDVMHPVRAPKTKANPLHRDIFDADGNQVGHCGLGMSSAGVSRFTGTRNNRLTPKGWMATRKAVNKAALTQAAKIKTSLKTDKGSVSRGKQ
jgi:hypothetical protein